MIYKAPSDFWFYRPRRRKSAGFRRRRMLVELLLALSLALAGVLLFSLLIVWGIPAR